MRLENVTIPGRKIPLAGLRYLPTETPQETALIFAHGFTSGKYSLDGLAGYLAGRGYEGLTFDCVGHKLGATGGEMRSVFQAAENLQDAFSWFRRQTAASRLVFVGHSMGGVAALQVAAWERELRAATIQLTVPLTGVVTMCVGTEPARGFDSLIGKTMLAQREDYVAGTPARTLLDELDKMIRAASEIGNLPALLVAARQDVLVGVERVEALAKQIGPNAQFEVIDASHQEAPDRVRPVLLPWLQAHTS